MVVGKGFGSWSSVNGAKLGLSFICVYAVVIGSRVGANAMVLEVDGYGGLRNSGFGVY